MALALESWKVQPHDELVEVDEGLLTVAGEIVMPLGRFPRRMTVVALDGRRTAIFSAIALREPEMARIEALGKPSVLIVPSDNHRLDAKIWKQRYPDLVVLTPSGARAGVEKVVPVDATEDKLGDANVRFITVEGVGGHEAAVTVRRTAGLTLIVNDIIARVAHPHGLGAKVMARLFGFGVSRPQIPRPIRSRMIKEPRLLAAQMRRWASEPELRRIIPSHGEVIQDDPAQVLKTLAASLDDRD